MRRHVTAALVGVLAFALPAVAKKSRDPGSLLLPHADYLPLTPEQSALKEASFALGAPAVILFEGWQHEWDASSDGIVQRRNYHRRLKILTPAGVADHGDISWELFGDTRVHELRARTIRPDGSMMDCTDAIVQTESNDRRSIRLAWPQVEVGSILDYQMVHASDSLALPPRQLQGHLPVLESRLVVIPLTGMKYRTATIGLTEEQATPMGVRHGREEGVAWVVRELPPIPDIPYLPAESAFAATIFAFLESYSTGVVEMPYAPDWETYARNTLRDWNKWMKGADGGARALARQVCEGAVTPQAKADAIRQVLADRIRVDWHSWWPGQDTPDAVLSAGHGRSADMVGLAATMLKAVGLPSRPCAFRGPYGGLLPIDAPLPAMLEDLMLEVTPKDGASFWFVPWAAVPAGTLPPSVRGLNVLPLDEKVEAPIALPEWTPDDNHVSYEADVTVARDGGLDAQVTITSVGSSAGSWRERLVGLAPDARVQAVQDRLRRHVPDARVEGLEITGLDAAPTAPLVFLARVTSSGATQVAGQRLLLNPNLFSRVLASTWAAETRDVGIDMGAPFRVSSRVALHLPAGTEGVTLPPAQVADGGEVGRYELAFSAEGATVTARRSLEMRQTRFPAATWQGLRDWFQNMAAADDGAMTITLAEGQ